MSEKLTIAYFTNADWVHTRQYARFFASRGHRVVFISFKDEAYSGIEVHTLRKKHLGVIDWFTTLGNAQRLVRKLAPHVVHYHFAPSFAYIAANLNFHPSVITIHGTDVLSSPKDLRHCPVYTLPLMPLAIAALKKADMVTSVAGHLTGIIRSYGVSKDRLTTFQYGVDLESFKSRVQQQSEPIILSTRNYFNYYRLDVLVKAAALVISAHPTAQFLFAGEGPQRNVLERLISSYGITANCQLMGLQTAQVILDLCERSAIYASSSAIDGTSLSLLEAMATGLYPVVSDIAANRYWIRDGEGGTLVPSNDPEVWAQALLRALDDAPLRERAAKINRARVEQDADWQKNMLRLEKIYYDLIENTANRRGGLK